MLRKSCAAFFGLLLTAVAVGQSAERHFQLHYSFIIRNVKLGEPVKVWIPLAHSDPFQEVRILSTTGDLPLRKTRDTTSGNEMLYGESQRATSSEYRFTVDYDVVRHERVANLGEAHPPARAISAEQRQFYLRPDRLVPVNGRPAQIAAEQVKGKVNDLERARALYNYVLANMQYDKTGTGWGRGDVLYACNAKKGNCTDFHSLFIAMARSQKIPARFEIGFPLPAHEHSGEIPGYHCWADFYIAGKGWIPVDISEAWQNPDKRDYFFGAHDDNRVQFTMGRDLRLNPPQNGPPLNYFIYPYVEVEGKAFSNVDDRFSFADVSPAAVLRSGR